MKFLFRCWLSRFLLGGLCKVVCSGCYKYHQVIGEGDHLNAFMVAFSIV